MPEIDVIIFFPPYLTAPLRTLCRPVCALFIAMTGLVLARVVDPVTAQQIVTIITGQVPWQVCNRGPFTPSFFHCHSINPDPVWGYFAKRA